VRVVRYPDDDDVDVRFAWNVAKHYEENNTVRWSNTVQWSTVAAQIGVPVRLYKRHGCWTKVSQQLEELHGPSKKNTLGRWIRAARGMHPEVALDLANYPQLPATAIYDNEYMVLQNDRSRYRLTASGAKAVLAAWKVAQEELDVKVSSTAFVNTMCRGMRILEVWHSFLIKRFGSVATNSKALKRLMEQLGSFSGLKSVMATAAAGLNLHGNSAEQQGIPACYSLFQELEKCKAGGLPPPDTISTSFSWPPRGPENLQIH